MYDMNYNPMCPMQQHMSMYSKENMCPMMMGMKGMFVCPMKSSGLMMNYQPMMNINPTMMYQPPMQSYEGMTSFNPYMTRNKLDNEGMLNVKMKTVKLEDLTE